MTAFPYLSRLDRQIETFGFEVEAVGLDAGYNNAPLCHGLVERGLVHSVIGYCRPSKRKGMLAKRDYRYDAQQDCYHCPQNEILRYKTTNGEGYRLYASDPDTCRECPLRAQCTKSKSGIKQVSRHVWQGDRERIDQKPADRAGQTDLQGTARDGGAQFCGCETAPRAQVCALSGSGQGADARVTGRRVSEHEENRVGTEQEGKQGHKSGQSLSRGSF